MLDNSVTLMEQWREYLAYLLSPETLTIFGTSTFKILVIVFISYIAMKAFNRIIDATFSIKQLDANKSVTLTKLLKSIFRYVVNDVI